MPRRLPVRPAKVFGNFFVLIVLCLMAVVYYTFVFVLFGPRAESKLLFLFLSIFCPNLVPNQNINMYVITKNIIILY